MKIFFFSSPRELCWLVGLLFMFSWLFGVFVFYMGFFALGLCCGDDDGDGDAVAFIFSF